MSDITSIEQLQLTIMFEDDTKHLIIWSPHVAIMGGKRGYRRAGPERHFGHDGVSA